MTLPDTSPAPGPQPNPLHIAAHALWIGPTTTAAVFATVVVITYGVDGGAGASEAVAALWFGVIALVVGLPISLLCSGAAGLSAGWVTVPLARTRAPRAVRALAGGLASSSVVGVPLLAYTRGAFAVPLLVICLVTGAAAVLVAGRGAAQGPAGSGSRRRGAVWLAVTIAAGLATWTALLGDWLDTSFTFDPVEVCAIDLGVAESRVAHSGSTGFPLASWCVAGDRAVRMDSPWIDSVVVGLLVVTVLCALVWLVRRFDGGGRLDGGGRPAVRWAYGSTLFTLGLLGAWWAVAVWDVEPPAQVLVRAAELGAQADEAEAEAAQTPLPEAGAAPSDAPAPTPEQVSPEVARTELEVLQGQALAVGGPDLLWQQPLATTEVPCYDAASQPGTALELTGLFTTRDLATAKDNVDFLLITQDNEDVAAAIVDAWTGGSPDRVDVMKGEYWFVPDHATTVETAHVGFVEGVGEIRATTFCAVW